MAPKAFYKIGEACKHLDIQPYVLRYWETEFPMLEPETSKSGQRVYSHDDMGVIQRIKELLYDEGFTIAGAKKKLEAELANGREMTFAPPPGPKPVPALEPQKDQPTQEEPAGEKAAEEETAPEKTARDAAEEKVAASKPAAVVESSEAQPTAKSAAKSAARPAAKKAKRPATKKTAAQRKGTEQPRPKPGKKTLSASPTTGDSSATGQPVSTAEPETRARVRQLEKGIRSALEEARAILSILENEPAGKQATKK